VCVCVCVCVCVSECGSVGRLVCVRVCVVCVAESSADVNIARSAASSVWPAEISGAPGDHGASSCQVRPDTWTGPHHVTTQPFSDCHQSSSRGKCTVNWCFRNCVQCAEKFDQLVHLRICSVKWMKTGADETGNCICQNTSSAATDTSVQSLPQRAPFYSWIWSLV